MKRETRRLLKAFGKTDLFAIVGQPERKDVKVARSWKKAISSCSSRKWENLKLEVVNDYCEALALRPGRNIEVWNDKVDEIQEILKPLVEVGVTAKGFPEAVASATVWDMTVACLEQEFVRFLPLGFHTALANWYLEGRFPCGWDGRFPEGSLIIY